MGRNRQRSRILQLFHRSPPGVEEVQVFFCDIFVGYSGHDYTSSWHVCAVWVEDCGFCGDFPDGYGLGESSAFADCAESGVDDVYVLDYDGMELIMRIHNGVRNAWRHGVYNDCNDHEIHDHFIDFNML
jgi:hypothetical protein